MKWQDGEFWMLTYKKKYDGDKSKRNFIAYADDIYSHLSLLVEIVDTYNKTSIR